MEEKVFRDPIHGYIRVNNQLIWDCILTKEFQRLRRIQQLGSTSFVYHTGEHSRFAHSLGVYEIVRRMVNEVDDLRVGLNDYEKLTVMLAGLLHDIGHAPFSHSFEHILKKSHESYSMQIIESDSDIATILNRYNKNLAHDVVSVLDGSCSNPILHQLISSQLDADRMDYLLRDSYFTGTKYGEFDLERILRTMRVKGNRVVVKYSGMHTIEDYIMARYHMYWQVYYHNVCRGFEASLLALFKRMFDLYKEDKTIVDKLPMFKALLENEQLTNQQMYLLDDSCCWYGFNLMAQMDDKILADLASRILKRNIFKSGDVSQKEAIQKLCAEKGYPLQYYFSCDKQQQSPYHPYGKNMTQSIWVLMEDGAIEELSQVSKIVGAVCEGKDIDEKVFYPRELMYD